MDINLLSTSLISIDFINIIKSVFIELGFGYSLIDFDYNLFILYGII